MPRERLERYGKEALSLEELLAIVIKTGTKKLNVRELSRKIVNDLENINSLKDLSLEKLMGYPGIGKAKALEILSVIEIGKRVYLRDCNSKSIKISTANDVFNYIKADLLDKKQEHFYCIYLNNINNVIKKELIYIGTINQSIVHPRDIFKKAYENCATGIICVHNHPSGNVQPSKEDIITTKKIKEISNLLGIIFMDHIIVSNTEYYSFMEGNNL